MIAEERDIVTPKIDRGKMTSFLVNKGKASVAKEGMNRDLTIRGMDDYDDDPIERSLKERLEAGGLGLITSIVAP